MAFKAWMESKAGLCGVLKHRHYQHCSTRSSRYFGDNVFNTLIRDNVALAEAPSTRQDIFAYNSRSQGAEDYLALSKEVLERVACMEEV